MRTDLYAVTCVVHEGYAGGDRRGWAAAISWQDGRFCQPRTVEGTIRTRYFEETLEKAIDAVVEVAESFGLPLGFTGSMGEMPLALYYKGDGGDPDYRPPCEWSACKQLLRDEARRRGWESYERGVVV